MKKLLLSLTLLAGSMGSAQIFQENWDGNGPGVSGWILYNLDNRTPVGPDGTSGEPLSFLVQDAWTVLSLADIQGANPDYPGYPTAATGMDGNIIASNSWYNPIGVANDWLVSPIITVPAGTTGLSLNWAAVSLGNSSFLEDYRVLISPTGGSAVANFTSLLIDVNNELSAGNYRQVPLPASLAGTSFRIAFQNDGDDQYVMFLDNITVTGTLSNSEFLANKFNLYPNPSNSIVNISSDEAILIDKVEITDINGRIVKSFNAEATSSTSINVSDLNAGVYFLNISSAEGLAVKKLIKN